MTYLILQTLAHDPNKTVAVTEGPLLDAETQQTSY